MKRFRFSLQKVLEVRQTEEKIIQKQLAMKLREVLDARKQGQRLQEELQQSLDEKSRMEQGVFNSAIYMNHQRHLESLRDQLFENKQLIARLEEEQEEIRMKLLTKAQERKTIERLRETRLEEYRKEVKKEEQVFLDEISAQNQRYRMMRENS